MAGIVSGETLRLLAVGDWGGASAAPWTTPVQLSVAAAMGTVGATLAPNWVLGIGDNFYEDGISCVGDSHPNCTTDDSSHRQVSMLAESATVRERGMM